MRRAAFERQKGAPPLAIDLKRRRIIEAVYHCRLATTDHLQLIAGYKSRSYINNQLHRLFDAGYLDRPTIQKSLYAYAEKRPLLHALGDVGARYIRDEFGLPVPKSVQWGRKNRELKDAKYIAHTLGVSEAKVRFQTQLEQMQSYRLIHSAELIATASKETAGLGNPFSFPTRYRWTNGRTYERYTEPDWGFGIERTDGKSERKFALMFLEWDEGTEPYKSRDPRTKASLLQKYLGYADMWRSKLHTKRFGKETFRVLFVTRGGAGRVNGMIDLFRTHLADRAPPWLFFHLESEQLEGGKFLTDPVWRDGADERRQLLAIK